MCKYPSIYSPGKECAALQYICELLCQKKANFDKVQLPARFWDSMPKWYAFFKKNLRMVANLLKRYDERAIINALNSPKFGRRYSIFSEFAEDLIIEEQKKLNLEKGSQEVRITRTNQQLKPRPKNIKKGVVDKLEELDQEVVNGRC